MKKNLTIIRFQSKAFLDVNHNEFNCSSESFGPNSNEKMLLESLSLNYMY